MWEGLAIVTAGYYVPSVSLEWRPSHLLYCTRLSTFFAIEEIPLKIWLKRSLVYKTFVGAYIFWIIIMRRKILIWIWAFLILWTSQQNRRNVYYWALFICTFTWILCSFWCKPAGADCTWNQRTDELDISRYVYVPLPLVRIMSLWNEDRCKILYAIIIIINELLLL